MSINIEAECLHKMHQRFRAMKEIFIYLITSFSLISQNILKLIDTDLDWVLLSTVHLFRFSVCAYV